MAPKTSPIPVLNLADAQDTNKKSELLRQLHSALFDVGFLYIVNHGVPQFIIDNLETFLPRLFNLPEEEKARLSKFNSPHFLGYSGFAEEITLGRKDLREQFDFATELPVVYEPSHSHSSGHFSGTIEGKRDFTKLYWRLRGPNQFPCDDVAPGFRKAYIDYHDAVQELSYRFVNLIEESLKIPIGTFDHFFGRHAAETSDGDDHGERTFLPPQHRIKMLKYPPATNTEGIGQGVGAHKDSSGWLTFLHQVGNEPGLEVVSPTGEWISVPPMHGSFVVNFGNAFEAATEGAVKATIHRVIAPGPTSKPRYSIPFFQGLPLDMTVSKVRNYIPESVRSSRAKSKRPDSGISSFLDPRWDELGESQLRKWIRSHQDVALKWYGSEVVSYYTAT